MADCCSNFGYGETGPYAQRKAYDMLIQAESGLASITGGPEAPARGGRRHAARRGDRRSEPSLEPMQAALGNFML